ncbi:bile acid:sodium symporter family protein [Terrimonas sp. NA20]|uniref:Bile acid:sodium symporter family protein n=1 Tax=Terrimonas ginsenosidimutans TaxID=2908004 RepID=A0ABS9KSK1_9BACT|nr:bile acid:sodium symporter family protein [Terrimonas ginsenosidimutans]MCG2615308.1 bile acid:sodium symporter family protein [Terrimonas ginsenosidimutans]
MKSLNRISLLISGIAVITVIAGIVLQNANIFQPASLIAAVTLAIGLGSVESMKGYRYTAWIIAAVVAGMMYPQAFLRWGDINLRDKTLILVIIQLVMFGMGTHMSLRDFKGFAATGKGVLIGLFCHFSIMPLMGLLLINVFDFEPEIAAGIILIGSCSSGLASNVMVYLARANLVLSVIVTAMATLVAPFLTPLLMKLLAGTLVEVNFIEMMMEIIKIVLVPIGAALLHDFLKTASSSQKKKIYTAGLACAVWLAILLSGLSGWISANASVPMQQSLSMLSFFAGAIIAGILYHQLYRRFPKIDSLMPYLSMFGIIYFTTVTTAAGRDNLLRVGFLLFVASVIHNAAGYFFGYWLSRLFGMDKNSSRTIAFEVGLQNGGMASGLAGAMGKLGTVGLAAAVFSPWMNISGSLLANYWRKRPVKEEELFHSEGKVASAGDAVSV